MNHQDLTDFSRNGTILLDISSDLFRISGALHVAGNTSLAERLEDMAVEIKDTEKEISDTVGRSINSDFKRSQESTGNVIMAALNDTKLIKQNPDQVDT